MSYKKSVNPPEWAKRFFEWYCGTGVADDLIGDMDELFWKNIQKMSPRAARGKYCFQVLTLIFSYGIKRRKMKYRKRPGGSSYPSIALYKSYFRIAFRNLSKQKAFSIINIICLSVGMSVGLLALAVFVDILGVDDFQANAKRIYRITTHVDDKHDKITYASSSAPLGEKLREEVAGVEEVLRMARGFNPEIVLGANAVIPLEGYYAEKNFFSVFSFSLVDGNAQKALSKPFSVVITQSAAMKLFRDVNIVGKVLEVKDLGNFEVTGVVRDHPRSHLTFEILASFNTIASLEQQKKIQPTLMDWGPVTNFYTYVLLNKNKPLEDVTAMVDKTMSSQFRREKNLKVTSGIQSLNDIAMSELQNEIGLSYGYGIVMVFFFLTLLVLLPACFNYTNIAIARALKRAKEIGLRKVSGGQSNHIFLQMVLETIILSVLSLFGALLIFLVIRDEFLRTMVVGGTRTLDLEVTPKVFFIFFLFAVFTGLLAGIFPASYFSKLNPIETLRSASQAGKLSKISIRKGLIVMQFALSMIFILGVGIVIQQYRHAINYDLGFQKENILDIPLKGTDAKLLKNELEKLSAVTAVSMSSAIPGSWRVASTWVRSGATDSIEVHQMFVDQNYLENLEINLIAGSDFPVTEREQFVIVNETFLKRFNIQTPIDALDKSVTIGHKELRVIGVVKDFNFLPLQQEISSFFFRMDPTQFNFINVKLQSDDIGETLAEIETIWNRISVQKFEAKFLDDELETSLTSFRNMIRIFGFLAVLAVSISCFGLLAIIISAVESRMREMGIRKVFGAGILSLALVLTKGFLRLVVIAVLIATPLTYVLFDQIFLRRFFYRASIGLTEIGLSILLLFSLVLIIIGSQTLKVARVNPMEILKYE